jgi:hypothetical protein
MNRRSFFSNLAAAVVAPLFTAKAQAPPIIPEPLLTQAYEEPAWMVIRTHMSREQYPRFFPCASCGSADCRHVNARLCAIDQNYRSGWLTDRPPFLFNPRMPLPSYGDEGDPDDEVVRVVEVCSLEDAPFVLLPPVRYHCYLGSERTRT